MIHDDKSHNGETDAKRKVERMKKGINRDKKQTNIYVLHDPMYKFWTIKFSPSSSSRILAKWITARKVFK